MKMRDIRKICQSGQLYFFLQIGLNIIDYLIHRFQVTVSSRFFGKFSVLIAITAIILIETMILICAEMLLAAIVIPQL